MIGVAVLRDGELTVSGALLGGSAWSTAKVPVAVAAIEAGVAGDDALRRAITASDNDAAEELWAALGGGMEAARAAERVLRACGDEQTVVESQRLRPGYTPFGQSEWTLAAQARFVAGLPSLDAGRRVLALMGAIVEEQRWGLGTIAGARFKGGWGPGVVAGQASGWLERQMGLVTVGGQEVAVAIAAETADHAAGTAALTRLAAQHLL